MLSNALGKAVFSLLTTGILTTIIALARMAFHGDTAFVPIIWIWTTISIGFINLLCWTQPWKFAQADKDKKPALESQDAKAEK